MIELARRPQTEGPSLAMRDMGNDCPLATRLGSPIGVEQE